MTDPQLPLEPAPVWEGRASGEAFAELLQEKAEERSLQIVVVVQPWRRSGTYGVTAEWGDGDDQSVMYEVADWVDGCRLLDPDGEELTLRQGLAYLQARVAGAPHRQALLAAEPGRASYWSRWLRRRHPL